MALRLLPSGCWEGIDAYFQYSFDPYLCLALIKFFKAEAGVSNIVDFGCGLGKYVKKLRKNGFTADGYDGNPDTIILTDNTCSVQDLSSDIGFLAKQYDWALSLAVGEYIPAYYEDTFINNLHQNNTKGIILSWATPGQGDIVGHVNEQENAYIKNKICALGYTNDIVNEEYLRGMSSLRWFPTTIMVFRKNP